MIRYEVRVAPFVCVHKALRSFAAREAVIRDDTPVGCFYLRPPAAHAFTLVANLSEQSVSCALSATGETLATISVFASPPRLRVGLYAS